MTAIIEALTCRTDIIKDFIRANLRIDSFDCDSHDDGWHAESRSWKIGSRDRTAVFFQVVTGTFNERMLSWYVRRRSGELAVFVQGG